MALTWYLDVDWDNNGSYETNEAARMLGCEIVRGRDHYIKTEGDGFERWQVGKARITLANYDGRFDAYNTNGPLYGNILPGRFAKIRVYDGATMYTLFSGRIANIKPIDRGHDRRVLMLLEDGIRFLKDNQTTITLYEDLAIEDAIDYILGDIDWPTTWWLTSLGAAASSLDYFWADDEWAYPLIMDLATSEFGYFYIGKSGRARFRGRHAIAASQATYTQDLLLREIGLPFPWEFIRNEIVVTAWPRVEQTTSVLWTLADVPGINPGAEWTVYAQLAYDGRNVPGKTLTCVATTDYTFNSAADGSGDDLTADFAVAITPYGSRPLVTVTSSASVVGYPTLLRINGVAVDAPNPSIQKVASSVSKTKFGGHTISIDLPWQQNSYAAADFANMLKTHLGVESLFPIIQIEDRPTIQFPRDLTERVTVTIDEKGVDADFRIGKITHRWMSETGQQVRTTFKTEPFMDIEGHWIFPTKMGETSVFAY